MHGHFYQPPRENPWTGRIADEPTAAPFENWNERITSECYAPLARGGAFEWLSFDLGPTLARWLEAEHSDVHDALVEGDRASRARLGHGNALAQPFHHLILPLASEREKATEIRWGLQDFERRFGRKAHGMWLPETAVDLPTLSALAAAGVAFTVLAGRQVVEFPLGGVGRVSLEGGRDIAVFVYDDTLSHGIAFGALLSGEDAWFARIRALRGEGQDLITTATDGETFGHHHEGADAALLRVLERVRSDDGLRIENLASVLARRDDLPAVQLVEPSSWSCEHGIERWRSDCGCKAVPERSSQQQWRAPLRTALAALATELDRVYEELADDCLADPSGSIAELGAALGGRHQVFDDYVRAAASSGDTADRSRALLEIVRDRHAMFTSCGWFFDDVAGLEASQVLRYAAHALSRLGTLLPDRADALADDLRAALSHAPVNAEGYQEAGEIYQTLANTDG